MEDEVMVLFGYGEANARLDHPHDMPCTKSSSRSRLIAKPIIISTSTVR